MNGIIILMADNLNGIINIMAENLNGIIILMAENLNDENSLLNRKFLYLGNRVLQNRKSRHWPRLAFAVCHSSFAIAGKHKNIETVWV